MHWVLDPHSGGVKLTDSRKTLSKNAIKKHAEQAYLGRCSCVKIRFRSQFCYIDAVTEEEGREFTQPLCRLRHFDLDRWSIALFTWSNERYEPAMFPNGEWFGTLEECVELGGAFL